MPAGSARAGPATSTVRVTPAAPISVTSSGQVGQTPGGRKLLARPVPAPFLPARVPLAQNADQQSHLLHGATADHLDDLQRLAGFVGLGLEHRPRATLERTATTLMVWATTSCSSRAMRSRSSVTARRLRSSRWRSRSAAHSVTPAM